MKPPPKPTVESVARAAERLKTRFTRRDADWQTRKATRLRERAAEIIKSIPEEYRETSIAVQTPEIENTGMVQTNILASSKPTAQIPPPKPQYAENSTLCERLLNRGNAELEAENPSHAPVCEGQVFYGAGVYKCYPRRKEERWPDYPQRKEDETAEEYNDATEAYKAGQSLAACFYYGWVPWNTLYVNEDVRGICEALEIKQVVLSELMERYPAPVVASEPGVPLWESGANIEELWTVTEYWNRTWRAIVADSPKKERRQRGKLLDLWQHNFDRVPYFVAPAQVRGEIDPALRYVPLLEPMYPEAEYNNRIRTMQSNVASFVGWPYFIIERIDTGELVLDPVTKAVKVFQLRPGKAEQLAPGQKLVQIKLEGTETLAREVVQSDLRLLRYSSPEILEAKAPGADFPGYGMQLLQRAALTRLDPLLNNRSRAIREMYCFILWSVKHIIGETVYVSGYDAAEGDATARFQPVKVSPADIITFNVSVSLEADLPTDRIALEKHGAELLTLGLISRMEFQESYRGKDAPEEVLQEISADRIAARMEGLVEQMVIEQLTESDSPMRLFGGEKPEEVERSIARDQRGLGKGSPGQPRTGGVRMPTAPPMEGSPTFAGPGGAMPPMPEGMP